MANSADSDQMLQDVASDQDLHCLRLGHFSLRISKAHSLYISKLSILLKKPGWGGQTLFLSCRGVRWAQSSCFKWKFSVLKSGFILKFPITVIVYTSLWHYENMRIQIYWKFYHQKWKFSDKNSDIFNIFAQNIDCGYSLEPPRRGGSNEYPQSMFLSRNKKNNVYPCQLQFYYIKVGFKWVKII